MDSFARERKQTDPGGSFMKLYVEFIREFLPHIGPTAFTIYCALLSHRNHLTGQCNPSIATLIRETGLDRRTIRRALSTLVTYQLVEVKHTWGPGGQNPNDYILPDYWTVERPTWDFSMLTATGGRVKSVPPGEAKMYP